MEGGHFQRIIGLALGKGTVSHTTTWAIATRPVRTHRPLLGETDETSRLQTPQQLKRRSPPA